MWHEYRIYSIVGSISTKEREEFTAIGSSINLASRLENRATADQIIVSSHTRERIQNQFDIKPVTVKVGEAFEYECEYYKVLGKVEKYQIIRNLQRPGQQLVF